MLWSLAITCHVAPVGVHAELPVQAAGGGGAVRVCGCAHNCTIVALISGTDARKDMLEAQIDVHTTTVRILVHGCIHSNFDDRPSLPSHQHSANVTVLLLCCDVSRLVFCCDVLQLVDEIVRLMLHRAGIHTLVSTCQAWIVRETEQYGSAAISCARSSTPAPARCSRRTRAALLWLATRFRTKMTADSVFRYSCICEQHVKVAMGKLDAFATDTDAPAAAIHLLQRSVYAHLYRAQ